MDNWNDLKLFNREELLEMVPDGFTFHTKPWTHQIAAFLANISNDGFLDALDLGVGKTKVAIDTCRYIDFYNGGLKKIKVLFVCLNSAVEKMKDEVETHSELSAVCLKGSKEEKWRLLGLPYNFYIINYEGLRSLLSEREVKGYVGVVNKKSGKIEYKKKSRDEISSKAVNTLLKKNFDALIIDESHTVKTPTSLIFRVLKLVVKRLNRRFLLTGTPFGNTLLDVWSQYFIADKGETFGASFKIFKLSYFKDKGYFGPLWVPTETGKEYIESNLYRKAIRYEESECEELPPKVFRVLNYNLGPEQRKAYNELIDEQYSLLTVDIASKAIGFRTISSGFIKSSNYEFKNNPKLELLWDIIEAVHEKHKIVVFFEYTMSREIVERFLKKKKIPFNSISGKEKDKYRQISSFQNDPKYRVMCAQIKSGGASIDLFAACYCVFFELGGSIIQHKQALKRIHRGGQTQRCFFYYLLGTNTVEVSIYKDLSKGVDAFAKIVDGEAAKRYIMGVES